MITGFCWGGRITAVRRAQPTVVRSGSVVMASWWATRHSPAEAIPLISPPIFNAPVLGFIRRAGCHQYSTGVCGNYASALRAANAKAEMWFIPMQGTRLMPIIVRGYHEARRKTAGKECWNGSRSTGCPHKYYDVCWAYETGVGGSTKRHRH